MEMTWKNLMNQCKPSFRGLRLFLFSTNLATYFLLALSCCFCFDEANDNKNG